MLEHLINRKPRVALLGCYLDLYNHAFPGYAERMGNFARAVADGLSTDVDVVSVEPSTTESRAREIVQSAETAEVDALLLLSLGYTNSLTVTPALIESGLPLVVFNTQEIEEVTRDYTLEDLLNNHGMQGVQDICSVLVREGRTFGIVTGLLTEPATRAELVEQLDVHRAVRQIGESRLTRLSDPQAGMGDMDVDLGQLRDVFGIEYVDLDGNALARAAADAAPGAIEAPRDFDRQHFDIADDLTPEDHERSLRLEVGLRQLLTEHQLAGLTLSFDTIIGYNGIETMPFLGLSKLMAEGMAYAGEGDLLATAGGIINRCLCGETCFTELYTMDFKSNGALNSHMAECNPAMARRDRRPRLFRREFTLADCQPFASLAFSLEPGVITLSDLTLTADGEFHFITMLAEVADFPPLEGFELPNFKIQFERDIREILNEYSLAGGTHHLSLAYGDHLGRYRLLGETLGIAQTEIGTG